MAGQPRGHTACCPSYRALPLTAMQLPALYQAGALSGLASVQVYELFESLFAA